MSRRLIALGVIIAIEAAAGTLFWEFVLKEHPDAILSVTSFTIAITAFFGLMAVSGSLDGKVSLTKGAMRTAIAGAIVVTYLYVLSLFTFLGYIGELPEMVRLLLSSLTTVVSITVVFYFGSEAVINLFGKESTTEREPSANKENT